MKTSKKCPHRFTIQFNPTDPIHKATMEYLDGYGRNKTAQAIANLFVEARMVRPTVHSAVAVDETTVARKVVAADFAATQTTHKAEHNDTATTKDEAEIWNNIGSSLENI